MLTIRHSQLAQFENAQQTAFLEKVCGLIESSTGRTIELDDLAKLFERGKGYGLVSEREFARYLFIAATADAAGMDSDPDWIADIMATRGEKSLKFRLDALFSAAEHHLAHIVPDGRSR